MPYKVDAGKIGRFIVPDMIAVNNQFSFSLDDAYVGKCYGFVLTPKGSISNTTINVQDVICREVQERDSTVFYADSVDSSRKVVVNNNVITTAGKYTLEAYQYTWIVGVGYRYIGAIGDYAKAEIEVKAATGNTPTPTITRSPTGAATPAITSQVTQGVQPTAIPTQSSNNKPKTRGEPCTRNTDCAEGLACGADYGAEFGHGATISKCFDPEVAKDGQACVNALECTGANRICSQTGTNYTCGPFNNGLELRRWGLCNGSKNFTCSGQLTCMEAISRIDNKVYKVCIPDGLVPEGQICVSSVECQVGLICAVGQGKQKSGGVFFECQKPQPVATTGPTATPKPTNPTPAGTGGVACGPIHIAIVANGYGENMKEFDEEAKYIMNTISNAKPFNPSMFKFKIIKAIDDTTICKDLDAATCDETKHMHIESAISKASDGFPITKIIFISKYLKSGKDIFSGSSFSGGTTNVIVDKKTYEKMSPDASYNRFLINGFLGVMVSWLSSRMVAVESNKEWFEWYKSNSNNCSANPDGEEWWKQARDPNETPDKKNAYKGCLLPDLYAPYPPNCPWSDGSNGGNSNTVMSDNICAKTENFDKVEEYYIKNYIFPFYKLCTNTTPTSSATKAPSPTKPSEGGSTPAPTKAPTPVPTAAATTPTPNVSGKVTCEPEGGIEKRYDGDKLIVKNNTGKEVKFRVQYNVCPFKGETTPLPAGYECNTYKDHDEITLKAGESHTFGWGQDRHTTKAPIALSSCQVGQIDVYNVTTPEGCIRTDNGKPWDGGLAFTIKANKTGYPDKCTEEATVQKQYQAYTCRENPNCPITTGFSACALICEPAN